MSKLPIVNFKTMDRVLHNLGFNSVRQELHLAVRRIDDNVFIGGLDLDRAAVVKHFNRLIVDLAVNPKLTGPAAEFLVAGDGVDESRGVNILEVRSLFFGHLPRV